jgi:hypothetical protein
MTWTQFWEIIDKGSEDPGAMKRELEDLSESELVDFHWKYEEVVAGLKDDEFTQNLSPPYSEDILDDLAKYVVEQGLDFYESVLEDPSTFPQDVPADATPGTLAAIPLRVYRARFGTHMRMPDDPPPDSAE